MDQNQDLSDLPDLEDFTPQFSKLKLDSKKNNESDVYIGDILKPKVSSNPIPIDPLPNPSNTQNPYSGLKKGFFNQPSHPKSKIKEIEEIKPDIKEKSRNKLEIPEVQTAMNMNNFLMNEKDKWLTPELLQKITENPVLSKLFSNPEYLNAMTLMQKDPKGVMSKYRNNPEFMQIFQEFCKTMGTHFTDISPEEKTKTETNEEKLQKIIENDKEVQEILQDPHIQNLLQFLQKNQKLELNKIMEKNPNLAKKLNILIKKGIINVQNY